jgi:hypothetical protein
MSSFSLEVAMQGCRLTAITMTSRPSRCTPTSTRYRCSHSPGDMIFVCCNKLVHGLVIRNKPWQAFVAQM